MSVRQGDTTHWAFLSIAWGITADIDIESEKWRWMGEARFTVAAIPSALSCRVSLSFVLSLDACLSYTCSAAASSGPQCGFPFWFDAHVLRSPRSASKCGQMLRASHS